jgi:predicted RNA-binding protein with PIN domain
MIIVIDGYNVLKQALGRTEIAQREKDTFIKQLSRYAKKKGHAVLVVFDGGSTQKADKERIDGISVVHSGFEQSADDWIKNYMQQHKGHDLLLVSTDRELGASVKRMGITCLDSMDFYKILQESTLDSNRSHTTRGPIIKTASHETPGLDDLMMQASRIVNTKLDDAIATKQERKSAAHTVSKKDRQALKKLKKL